MRLVATEYVTLDGVFEEPGRWPISLFGEDEGQFKWRELQASDALLLGRRTYEGFAAAWPTMPGTGEFGEKMNSMTKYVVSSTLDKVEWTGSKLVKGDLPTEIRKLKEKPGKDLLLSGSAMLFNACMKENLIDLYRLMLHPFTLGKGARLFHEGAGQRVLKLTDVIRFDSGISVLEYQPRS